MDFFSMLRQRRDEAQARLDAAIQPATDENRDLTPEEDAEFRAAVAVIEQLDARIADVHALEESRRAADAHLAELGQPADPGSPAQGSEDGVRVRVGAEPATYHRNGAHSWFRDITMRSLGRADADAHQRLERHEREVAAHFERAGLTTVDGAGGTFVPPVYLIDQYVPLARPGRPFADASTCLDLPRGTDSINLPKVTAGTAVAPQATQNTAVTETDLTDAYVSSPVVTIAGQQTVSLQLIEQSPIAFDEVVFADLTKAMAVSIDNETINGSGSGGHLTGVLTASGTISVTYTDTTPSQAKLWPSILQAVGDVHAQRFMPPTHIWMTPQRWAWLQAGQDSSGRPFVLPSGQGPFNAVAVAEGVQASGLVGSLAGYPVYTDPTLPRNLGAGTNQDVILVTRQDDLYLWEGTLNARALPQTLGNQLSILLQVYEYAAFIPTRYPTSVAVISGTGMVVPAGY